MMKKILCLLAVLLMLTAGCTPKPPEPLTFTEADFSVTLTDAFEKSSADGLVYHYVSKDALLLVTMDDFSLFETAGVATDITLEEYAQIAIDTNKLGSTVDTDAAGNVYFTYTRAAGGDSFYYYAVVKRSEKGFWLCQFACDAADAETLSAQFAEWGASIAV